MNAFPFTAFILQEHDWFSWQWFHTALIAMPDEFLNGSARTGNVNDDPAKGAAFTAEL
jgi:hypothetical protein